MIDLGIDKLALIGAVALIVIGPEKLPRVARTVGLLVGKAQRYVSQVQAEVNRSIELEELKKFKTSVENSAREVESQVAQGMSQVEQDMNAALIDHSQHDLHAGLYPPDLSSRAPGSYTPPRKNWRLKRGAMPLWYKQQHGVRRHVQSGAARVARFRPPVQPSSRQP